MQTNSKRKPGLADLKQLRRQAEAADLPAPAPGNRERRKLAAGAKTVAPASPSADKASTDSKAASQEPSAISPADKALFRRTVGPIRRLVSPNRTILPPVPAAPFAVLQQKRLAAAGSDAAPPAPVSDHYAPARLAADASHFVQAGHGPDLLKKLGKRKWPIGATLDLHGSTLDEARIRLDGFLQSCLQHDVRCVRIVHGKGYGSKGNAPILKETVRRWLTQLDAVMAYIECDERDGGAGAVLALLRAGHGGPPQSNEDQYA